MIDFTSSTQTKCTVCTIEIHPNGIFYITIKTYWLSLDVNGIALLHSLLNLSIRIRIQIEIFD